MYKYYDELKQIYKDNNVVLEDDIDLVVDTVITFCSGLAKLSNVSFIHLFDILKKIDYIRFSIDDDIKDIVTNDDNCITFNFSTNDKTGIIVNEENDNRKIYGLSHELVHYFMKHNIEDNKIIENKLFVDEKDSRLYEGITELITQNTWHIIQPDEDCLGEKEIRYFLEVQVADMLSDAMGKSFFYNNIITSPNYVFDIVKSVPYNDTNLLEYIDKELKPLVPFRGNYNHNYGLLSDIDILNSCEAICDSYKKLKIERDNFYEVSCKK